MLAVRQVLTRRGRNHRSSSSTGGSGKEYLSSGNKSRLFITFQTKAPPKGRPEASDPNTMEDIRLAYRQAVRLEHPDTSEAADAEECWSLFF